jgi:hypothetical protein
MKHRFTTCILVGPCFSCLGFLLVCLCPMLPLLSVCLDCPFMIVPENIPHRERSTCPSPRKHWEALWIWVAMGTLHQYPENWNWILFPSSFMLYKILSSAFIYLNIRKYNTTCMSIKHFCPFQISRHRGCWQIKFMFGYKSERKYNIYCYSLLHVVLVNVFETSWRLIDFCPFLNFIIL